MLLVLDVQRSISSRCCGLPCSTPAISTFGSLRPLQEVGDAVSLSGDGGYVYDGFATATETTGALVVRRAASLWCAGPLPTVCNAGSPRPPPETGGALPH